MPPQLRKRPPPPPPPPVKKPAQISEARTAANNWARLRRYAAYLERQCPGLGTAREIYCNLWYLSCRFRDDFFAVCTETATQPCHLLDKFDVWNSFLQEINMELSENEPGRFGLNYAYSCNGLQGMKRSYFLVHWLLKQHCCIKILRIEESLSIEHLNLLCDGLHLNCGLKKLVVRCKLEDEALQVIMPAIGATLKTLEVLVFSAYTTPAHLLGSLKMILGTTLRNALSLASLHLYGFRIDAQDAEFLLSGLANCPRLKRLSADDYLLLPRDGAALAEFVATSTALKELRLEYTVGSEMKPLENFLKALPSNCNLEELRLSGFDWNKSAMDSLVEAVAQHSALKILNIGYSDEDIDGNFLAELMARNTGLCELVFGGGDTRCVDAFSNAIRKNTILQKLHLSLCGMEMQNYRELLTALSCNQSLQELEFEYVFEDLLGDLCQLMRETGTEGRVKFPADFEDTLEFITALKKCSNVTQMSYWSQHEGVPLPREAFSELIHYHQLGKLSIGGQHGPIDHDCLVDLSHFLSRTTTLKEAYLQFPTTPGSTRVLLDAVMRNQSLSKLSLYDWTFESSDIHRLYDIIKTKNLSGLHLKVNCTEHKAVDSLAEHVCENLSLLSMTVSTVPERYCETAKRQISKATQRNSMTLLRAMQFVMGRHSRHFAEAFETIFDLPSLVDAVQKSANEPEERAKEMVKSSKRYLYYNFLTIVGVVKDSVVCDPNGKIQLDIIGLDNWLHVRQYLKVADIKPEPVVGFYKPILPRKRSRRN